MSDGIYSSLLGNWTQLPCAQAARKSKRKMEEEENGELQAENHQSGFAQIIHKWEKM